MLKLRYSTSGRPKENSNTNSKFYEDIHYNVLECRNYKRSYYKREETISQNTQCLINRSILSGMYIVAPKNLALNVMKTAPIHTTENTTVIVIDISSNVPDERKLN
jgi:hypothetical protein